MGDALGTVGSGLTSAGHTIAGIPGGARDFLIGSTSADRSAGEQIQRLLATLVVGENMGAQIGMRKDWEKQDAAYQAAPYDPIYQEIARTQGPEGIRQFFGSNAPPLQMAPEHLPPGIAGPPDPTPRPVLPFYDTQQLKNEIQAKGMADYMARLDHLAPLAQYQRTVKGTAKGLEATIADRDLGVAAFPLDLIQDSGYAEHGFRLEPTNRLDSRGVPMVILAHDPTIAAGQEAEARARGTKRGEYTDLTGAPVTTTRVSAVAPAAPATDVYGEPLAAPTATGAPSLSIATFPGASGADLDLLKENQKLALQAQYARQKALDAARLKNVQLSEEDRKRLGQIAATRSFLDTYRTYGLNGEPGDPATGRAAIPSTLPSKRVSGVSALGELARQSTLYQGLERDPFLQGLQRYQTLGRPILARNLGGDVGNLSQNEQEAITAVMTAASKPELDDAVRQMSALVDAREAALLKDKFRGGASPGAAAPAAAPAIDLGRGFTLRLRPPGAP